MFLYWFLSAIWNMNCVLITPRILFWKSTTHHWINHVSIFHCTFRCHLTAIRILTLFFYFLPFPQALTHAFFYDTLQNLLLWKHRTPLTDISLKEMLCHIARGVEHLHLHPSRYQSHQKSHFQPKRSSVSSTESGWFGLFHFMDNDESYSGENGSFRHVPTTGSASDPAQRQ